MCVYWDDRSEALHSEVVECFIDGAGIVGDRAEKNEIEKTWAREKAVDQYLRFGVVEEDCRDAEPGRRNPTRSVTRLRVWRPFDGL